jgi:hypothetical protein
MHPCVCIVQVLAIPLCVCRYVIVPTRRSSAEAIHLMATHALGEAGSPYFIGLLADVSLSH